jgi:hypothetical protein
VERHKSVSIAIIGEATLADAGGVLTIKKSALERNICGTGTENQLVCSPSYERSTVGCFHDNTLVDGCDIVWTVVERSKDICTVANLGIALFGKRGGLDVLFC